MALENDTLYDLVDKLNIEADRSVRHIEKIRSTGIKIARKAEAVLTEELIEQERNQAKKALHNLIETLIETNCNLELDDSVSPNLVIPYLPVGDCHAEFLTLKFHSGESPWNFWLLDESVDTKTIHKNLLKKYQNDLLDPHVCQKSSESVCFVDRNKVYRGVVLQILSENRIKVIDCDSNATKVVSSDKIYKTDPDACSSHASALRCTITKDADGKHLWNANADLREIFCNALREATLQVRLIEKLPGSYPTFVVDVHMKVEDDAAHLKEWIVDRLLPEVKKLSNEDSDSICDYLSSSSLNPYCNEIDQPKICEETRQCDAIEQSIKIENDEINNLNYSTPKVSEKIVPAEANNDDDILNNLGKKETLNSEVEVVSSGSSGSDLLTSSKESLESNCTNKSENSPVSRLNWSSREFCPKGSSGRVNYNQKLGSNNRTMSFPLIQPQPNIFPVFLPPGPIVFGPPQGPPHQPSWSYTGEALHQGNHNWPYQHQSSQQDAWSSGNGSAFSSVIPNAISNNAKVSSLPSGNEVNAMAPEFVPKNNQIEISSSTDNQNPTNPNKLVPAAEHIKIRKSATLIKEGENLLVLISHIESPSEFFVHFISNNNKYLDRLHDDMFNEYTTKDKVVFGSCGEARNKLGTFCACKWLEDNHWYRAEVLDWAVGNNLVKVNFVDHGNTECVPLHCLQPLLKKYEKLAMCAQACHLAEVYPLVKGEPWSEESIAFFKTKVEISNTRVYSITVVPSNKRAAKTNSLSVLLYEGKATDRSTSVNDILVEQGFAWTKKLLCGPPSTSSSEVYHSLEEINEEKTTNLVETADNNPLQIPDTTHTPLVTNNEPLQIPDTTNGPEVVDDFEHWDPRVEDFESARNNPALDEDDACVAVSGYSARDEARICKFFARDGFCRKQVCRKEHSKPNPDGITTDRMEIHCQPFSQLDLPLPGEIIRIKVTAVLSVNLFYAQIEEKRGCRNVDYDKDEETLSSLQEYMNQPQNKMEMKFLSVPPCVGEMVLARDDDLWYRARVISTDDNPEVMFVDYGTISTISEKDLRKMEDRYMHLPFQAIECSLANIVPIDMDSEKYERGTDFLRQTIEGCVLSAKIYESEFKDVLQLQVLLQLDNRLDVGVWLVDLGISKPRPCISW